MKTDKKHLGTIHTTRSVDEYWQVRIQSPNETTFQFQMERTTPNGSKVYIITGNDIPNSLSKSL
jgi:hypothetical protein